MGFPTRAKWKTDDVMQRYGIILFTDGSKMVRVGVFSRVVRSPRTCQCIPGDTGNSSMIKARSVSQVKRPLRFYIQCQHPVGWWGNVGTC